MDEIISLTPGQLVIIDDITYVTLHTEDGSIALQEVPGYQQVIDQTGNTFLTSSSKDEVQNLNLEQSHMPVDLSIANLQLHDINTAADTNQSVSRQQTERSLQDMSKKHTQNQVSLFSQDLNAAQTFSDQTVEGEQARLSISDCQIQQNNSMPIPNDANALTVAKLSQPSMVDDNKQEILAYIKDLQSRGFVLDQPTINVLMSGEVRLSDLQIVYDTDEETTNIVSHGPMEQENNKTFEQVLIPLINVEEDEEFSFLRSRDSYETNNTDSSVIPKRQTVSNAYQQAYLNFVEAFKSDTSYDGVLDSEMAVQPVREFTKNDRGEITPYIANAYSSRGRGRGGIKHIARNTFQKRKFKEDDGDYEFENPNWNIYHDESPIQSKRWVGRPRRFGHKGNEDSDEDYVYDDSEDDSDVTDENLSRANVGRSSFCHNKIADEETFPTNHVLIQHQSQRGHRGRGRPRKNILLEPYQERHPEPGEVLHASLGDVHKYQIGDFVILRTDLFRTADFKLYLIKTNNMLVVYNPFEEGGKILHQATKFHMGTIGDIRVGYKAVQVKPITKLDKNLIFNVVEVKMPSVHLHKNINNLENDPVRVIFNVFIQVLCCQVLEKNFLNEIKSENYEHLHNPLKQLEVIILQCLNCIQNKIAWNPIFKETMDSSPFYKIYRMTEERRDAHYLCSEVIDPSLSANRFIKFFGPQYNYETLENTDPEKAHDPKDVPIDIETLHTTLHLINQSSVQHIENYHALRHFKKSMFRELGYILENKQRKDSEKRKSNKDLVIETLSDDNWMNYQLNVFKEIILKADIILEAHSI